MKKPSVPLFLSGMQLGVGSVKVQVLKRLLSVLNEATFTLRCVLDNEVCHASECKFDENIGSTNLLIVL